MFLSDFESRLTIIIVHTKYNVGSTLYDNVATAYKGGQGKCNRRSYFDWNLIN